MTTALGIDIDLSTDFLEDRLTDNCKCEAVHDEDTPTCSIQVTHRLYSCVTPSGKLVCWNTAAWTQTVLATKGAICAPCLRPVGKCWRLVTA